MRKVLENRSLSDEERMDALENQLKEARFLAEEADRKYDEASETILLPPNIRQKQNYTDLRDLIFYLRKNSFYVEKKLNFCYILSWMSRFGRLEKERWWPLVVVVVVDHVETLKGMLDVDVCRKAKRAKLRNNRLMVLVWTTGGP